MAGDLLHLRGTTAARLAYTPLIAEFVWDTDLSALYVGDGTTAGGILIGGTGGARYIIASFVPGILIAGQLVLQHRFAKAVTFPANFGAYTGHISQAGGTNNATASAAFPIDQAASATPNSWTNIGAITIGAGGVTPTFTTVSGTLKNFAQGDVLRVSGPNPADTTFANLYFTLVGFET